MGRIQVRLDPQKRDCGEFGACSECQQFLSPIVGESVGISFVGFHEFLFLMIALDSRLLLVGDF
jgi:hypothetical protein